MNSLYARTRLLACALPIALAALTVPAAGQMNSKIASERAGETQEQFLKRTGWWKDAKFGMFIHWGLYAVPADATNKEGQHALAEWYFSNKQAQMSDYEKFAAQFNPVNFDAKKWVSAAKNAGMKYIVLTSKHHDGFALWDSAVSTWDVMDATPFKRDIIKELSQECKRQGLRFGVYHSIMDWHHPDYLPRRPWEKEARPANGADFPRYVDYLKAQVRELVSNYGPLAVLWFDGEWENTWTHEQGESLYRYVRNLQPSILVNNRVDKGRNGMAGFNSETKFYGDFGTPEQEVPQAGFDDDRLWETCMTLNDTWGYARNDNNWKSATQLIRTLVDVVAKGGNLLLNVGPTEKGEFTPETLERLAALGRWTKANGKALYGTEKSPFKTLSFDGRCTHRGNTLYLHVFNWPANGQLMLNGLKTTIKGVRALATGERLSYSQEGDAVAGTSRTLIGRPNRMDPDVTVIEISLAGPLQTASSR